MKLKHVLILSLFLTPFLRAEESAEQADTYPLTTCLVSGEKLGGMGDPYVFTHEGTEVKLCCKMCVKKFKKDPETYLAKLKEAEKSAKAGASHEAAEAGGSKAGHDHSGHHHD